MKVNAKSHKGLIRQVNEDNYNVLSGYDGIPDTFIIADGMGGHNAGEVASQLAVKEATNHLIQGFKNRQSNDEILGIIKNTIEVTNLKVYEKSISSEETNGMGTTLIISVVADKKIFIGHIGDSRVYVFRDDKLIKLTTDHSYTEELIKNGSITREEAEHHPKKNLITRALGCADTVLIDLYSYEVKEKDVFLMCTDGLTNMLSENEIIDILKENEDLTNICEILVYEANKKGGEDNTTVIVFKNE